MATVTTRPRIWDREESQRRVAHPLERLRACIRFYVSVEGFAVLVLYLALWFWIGLLLDYGFFKAFQVDWVQELPHTFRVVLLCGLTAGLLAVVALKVALRLFREFRPAALALVLERRFSQLLGDRLITAVEMADPRLAARYGYSQAMIDETMRDAADKVEQIPVGPVFNWRRLWRYGAAVAALTVGLYVLAGIGYCAWRQTTQVGDFAWRFNDVAGIWFERNILLIDTIWPRQAQLEVIEPAEEEKKIGRGAPAPAIRVRAWKWVVADRDRSKAPEGWRPLTWADLTPELLGQDVPALPSGLQPRDPERGLTVDDVDLQLEKAELQENPNVQPLRDTMQTLAELAASPRMSRRLRKLEVADAVQVILKGATSRNDQTLEKQADNEYSGTVELKESVRYTVRGKDYYTPYKKITVVPPPDLVALTIDEDQPAYLYYRIPRGGAAKDLRGLKQVFRNRPVSLTGEKSSVDVPSGTDVVLTAKTDKHLRLPDGVRLVPRPGTDSVHVPIEQADDQTFQVSFKNVNKIIDLLFEFTDTDNVSAQRHIIIRPVPDLPPEVNAELQVLRKGGQGYLCTIYAMVPFSGNVRDDHGLSDLDYVYTLTRMEEQSDLNARVALAAGTVPFAPGSFGRNLTALAMFTAFAKPAAEDKEPEQKVRLATFDQRLREVAPEAVSLDRLLAHLRQPPAEDQKQVERPLQIEQQEVDRRLIKDFELVPEVEFFDVAKLDLRPTGTRGIQPHYKLRLGIVATDNNFETGPSTSQRKEIYTLLIISEDELLAEIGKDEEGLRFKLKETVERLKEVRVKLDNVLIELRDLEPDKFSPMIRRTEEVDETLVKGSDAAHEVHAEYQRILQELKINRNRRESGGLINKMIDKVSDKIVDPLHAAEGDFQRARDSIADFQKSLEAKNKDKTPGERARDDLDRVIKRLEDVLDAMGELADIHALIKILVKIRDEENAEYKRLQALKGEIEKRIFEQSGAEEPKDNKPKNK